MASELNFDILALILTVIPNRKDLLPLMKTCKTLYNVGVPRLFVDAINPKTPNAMRSLHRFLFADESRFRLFTSFTLHSETDLVLANEILRQTTHLTKLDLFDWPCSAGTEIVREVQQTVMNLTTLQTVGICPATATLVSGSIDIHEFIMNLQSPITYLGLYFFDKTIRFPVELDPFSLASPYGSTLEELSCFKGTSTSRYDTPCFPRMRVLRLYSHEDVDLRSLIQSCPNLKKLYVDDLAPSRAFDSTDDAKRDLNIKLQESVRWPYLELVSGDLHPLYDLDIACPMRKLFMNLRHDSFSLSPDEVARVFVDQQVNQLARVIGGKEVKELVLSSISFRQIVPVIRAISSIPSCTADTLKIEPSCSRYEYGYDDVVVLLDQLSRGIHTTSVKYLTLVIVAPYSPRSSWRTQTDHEKFGQVTAEEAFRRLDAQTYSQTITSNSPSLERFTLQLPHRPAGH